MPLDILEEVQQQQMRLQEISTQLNHVLLLLEGDDANTGLAEKIGSLDERFTQLEQNILRERITRQSALESRRPLSTISLMAAIILSFLHHVLLISDYRHPNNISSPMALIFGIILQISIAFLAAYATVQFLK